MDAKERVVRDFYAARARRDWHAVRELLAEDVVWQEAGEQEYSGEHRGRDTVSELLEKLVRVTGGTFALEPLEIICTADHVAAAVHWRAEGRGAEVEGDEIAVCRIRDGQIAGAWFFPDGNDADALGRVFSFAPAG